MSSCLALADEQDPFNLTVGTQAHYEDNLFRLPDSVNALAVLGKSQRSDWLLATNAGIKIDKPYSLQRFQLEANVVDNRYDTNSYLNYTALNYHAAWLWQLTPNISGTLSADRQQTLNSFSDFRNNNNQLLTTQSIQTNESRVFNTDVLIGGGWHLLAGASNLTSHNSQAFNAVGNYVQNGIEFGGKYVAASENAISLLHRESIGDFQGQNANPLTQLDSGFKQSETEAVMDWRLSGKSVINAHLGYLDRQYDHFSGRDYHGAEGRLTYNWTPTEKVLVNASMSRNLYSYMQDMNSYFVDDTLSAGSTWHITSKTNMHVRYDFSRLNYQGAIVPIAELRRDELRTFMVSADWQPLRTVTITATLERDTRSSNSTNFNGLGGDLSFNANSATISAQLLF